MFVHRLTLQFKIIEFPNPLRVFGLGLNFGYVLFKSRLHYKGLIIVNCDHSTSVHLGNVHEIYHCYYYD